MRTRRLRKNHVTQMNTKIINCKSKKKVYVTYLGENKITQKEIYNRITKHGKVPRVQIKEDRKVRSPYSVFVFY